MSSTPTRQLIRLADGALGRATSYEILLEWNNDSRLTTILLLEGHPLIGVQLLAEHLLQCEMTDGGGAAIEPL